MAETTEIAEPIQYGDSLGAYLRSRRVILALLVALLIGRAGTACCWNTRAVVKHGAGPPAIIVSTGLLRSSIESWDWENGRIDLVDSTIGRQWPGNVCLIADRAVGIIQRDKLRIVELSPPHSQSVVEIPRFGRGHQPRLIGTSKGRFALFEQMKIEGDQNDGTIVGFDLRIVDLNTGRVASSRSWTSSLATTMEVDRFVSNRVSTLSNDPENPNEPDVARWRVTPDGELKLDPRLLGKSLMGTRVVIAHGRDGTIRRLEAGESPSLDDYPKSYRESYTVVCETADVAHYILHDAYSGEVLLAHADSAGIQRLPIAVKMFDDFDSAFVSRDQRRFVATSKTSDVVVIDAATGDVVATRGSSEIWYRISLALSLGIAGTAFALFVTAWREASLVATARDLTLSALAWQAACGSCYAVFFPGLWNNSGTVVTFAGVIAVAVTGGMAVGWYWAHGSDSIWKKLRCGLATIALTSAPAGITFASTWYTDWFLVVFVWPMFAGLFFASSVALLLSPLRMTGWLVSNRPIGIDRRRFSLASMLAIITAIAVVMGFLRSGVLPVQHDQIHAILLLLPSLVVGVLFPAINFINSGSGWRVVSLFAVTLVTAVVFLLSAVLWPYQMVSLEFEWVAPVLSIKVGLLVMVASIVLRRAGLRWQKAASSSHVTAANS